MSLLLELLGATDLEAVDESSTLAVGVVSVAVLRLQVRGRTPEQQQDQQVLANSYFIFVKLVAQVRP